MATTAPTPTWSMGNVVQYTKQGVTDDTEQWSLGNVLSFLEYEAAASSRISAINININLNCNITISAGRAQ